MGKSRDTADGTRYVDASGDTMTGNLLLPDLGLDTNNTTSTLRISANENQATSGVAVQLWGKDTGGWGGDVHYLTDSRGASGQHRFWKWTGSAFVNLANIDAEGRLSLPYQPAWFAAGNVGWHTTSTGGIVPLAAVPMNRGNHYNTSGSKFTAPVTGVYQVNIMAYMNTTAQLCLKLNGSDYVPTGGDTAFMLFTNNATGHEMTSASGSIYLNAGDYIQLTARNNQSVTLYTGHTSFSGYLAG